MSNEVYKYLCEVAQDMRGIDISPIIALLVLQFVVRVLVRIL